MWGEGGRDRLAFAARGLGRRRRPRRRIWARSLFHVGEEVLLALGGEFSRLFGWEIAGEMCLRRCLTHCQKKGRSKCKRCIGEFLRRLGESWRKSGTDSKLLPWQVPSPAGETILKIGSKSSNTVGTLVASIYTRTSTA